LNRIWKPINKFVAEIHFVASKIVSAAFFFVAALSQQGLETISNRVIGMKHVPEKTVKHSNQTPQGSLA
jgi:hypothetical protein